MDAELEFAIQPNTTGKQLFDQVSKKDHKCCLLTSFQNAFSAKQPSSVLEDGFG